jgi:hypothetical protein
LEWSCDAQFQVLHIFFNRAGSTFADHPIDDELAVRVHAEENRLPSTFRVSGQVIFFFATNKTKHFVNLDEREIDLTHHLVQQEGGFTARHFQHRLNGVRMRFRDPCRSADAHAFNQEVYDSRRLFERRFEPA